MLLIINTCFIKNSENTRLSFTVILMFAAYPTWHFLIEALEDHLTTRYWQLGVYFTHIHHMKIYVIA